MHVENASQLRHNVAAPHTATHTGAELASLLPNTHTHTQCVLSCDKYWTVTDDGNYSNTNFQQSTVSPPSHVSIFRSCRHFRRLTVSVEHNLVRYKYYRLYSSFSDGITKVLVYFLTIIIVQNIYFAVMRNVTIPYQTNLFLQHI